MQEVDVMVLGTGPAATRVALKCSSAGRNVGVVDPRPFGGTCALRGCNPKKVLVRAAELVDWIERAKGTGVRTNGVSIDWSELIAFKSSFTDPITPWKESKFSDAGVRQFHGTPRFTSPARIAIDDEEIECGKIVVATGAVPMPLGIPGEDLLMTSDEFLELDDLPKRILFVGGGYVTFEFAHVVARAGADVTIVEMGERPLAHFDPDLVDCLVDRTRELGIELSTSTEVKSVAKRADGVLVVDVSSANASRSIEVDLVVHGAGRVPNTDGLDLPAGNIDVGSQGIEVNDCLQSVSNPAVYAAGDVAATGAPPLSPVATEEGRILAWNLLNDAQQKLNYGPVATVVFSVPALATVGLGENEAIKQSLQFVTRTGDRAGDNSMKKVGAKHARYKVLLEEPSGRILGAHLLGPDAAETINLFALAIQCGLTARELKSALFGFPTFANDVRAMV